MIAIPDRRRTTMKALRAWSCVSLLAILLATLPGCTARGDPNQPIPTAFIAAPQPATRLMVILPGRQDDLQRLRESGIVQSVHSAWPDADVVLAELTLDYYRQGVAPQRLRTEVIEPARARGYREIWLGGASLGATGSLLYDTTYPDEVDGLVLLAPYLGERALHREIDQAGGVAAWDAGPPQPITALTWQREIWRRVHAWSHDRNSARRVWLAYGEEDGFREAMPLLMPAIPADQVLVREGGHKWTVWTPAMHDILLRTGTRASEPSGKGGR
jgi:hypothetical protein